ncbi:MAG TPA: hypothetical protein VE842_12945 [Pyrinomonadaceae bacterium]|nr:hypothetical protein [Pyrinomonadaceae bacterium]
MEIQIAVTSNSKPIEELKKSLETQLDPSGADVKLELRTRKKKFRGIDPTILVAVVGAASVGLGSLITGLLQVGQQMAARKIVLEGQGGAKLEVPANTSFEKIDQLLERVNQMGEVKKISVQ